MKRWYVGYFYYGYLKQLKKVFEVNPVFKDVELWYPYIQELHYKDGQKIIKEVPIFRDYVLFQFDVDSLIWVDIIKRTPIIKFLKDHKTHKPLPLPEYEVENIIRLTSIIKTPNLGGIIGKDVVIIDGPFKGFVGKCKSIVKGRNTAKVAIQMFDVVERMVEIDLGDLELFGS